MKLIIKPIFFGCLCMLTLLSCNNEELFVENNSEIINPTTPEDDTVANEDATGSVVVTSPCDFNLEAVAANSTVVINCVMDLQGKTINLPANVTIVYEGGDIINGTLNFSNNNTISGELMNSSLTMAGSKPLMKDSVFVFDPKRWGIVEGQTTSAIAQRNNDILEGTMLKVKNLGISTFMIDKMDAYFEVSKVTSTTTNQNFYPELEAINIPSNFNLVMSDNTILRVFPTVGKVAASLLGIADASNITIKGGVLYGDRDIRQYTGANKEEGSHLLTIRSGSNIVIDGVNLTMGSLGGININSYGFTFQPIYNPTNNVVIKNCVFDKIRMIALPITDGYNIIIENNKFIDTAQPTKNSDGGVVGFAIDIEPVRKRDPETNELILYQKVHDVIIRNNIERGSRQGGFTIFIGQRITFEGNDMENTISYSFASDSKIVNNIFTASERSKIRPAISSGGSGDTVFGNEISGNTIIGYGTGISPYYRDLKIFNNTIKECTIGIQLKTASDMLIYNNKISSSLQGSRGIMAHIASVNNVDVYNNEISVSSNAFYCVQMNKNVGEESFKLNIFNNISKTNATTIFSDVINLNFKNNVLKGRVQITNSKNINISNNSIESSSGDGMSVTGISSNITIIDNSITPSKDRGAMCIRIDSINIPEVKKTGNNCN